MLKYSNITFTLLIYTLLKYKINMAKNIGTLISSAIRPNDSLDPIASHLVMKLKEVSLLPKV
jgi:hypothetical protein